MLPEVEIIIFIFLTLFGPQCKCLSTVRRNEQDPHLQVHISNGILQGIKVVSLDISTRYYYAFFGIPYAQPPVGNLRFRPPLSASNWSGILDAREERSKCIQLSEGSEDCLFLNVYIPYTHKLQENRGLLPVMVWIYGGAFATGSSNYSLYDPDYLLRHNIVMVAFNYRVGAFGFLNTGDMNSPGNYGLKDQVEALRWVQTNIRHFGGDPSQVTIFGESAGGASVHYLLQTPLTKGLFQRAISESGSALCTWAFTREPKKAAFELGIAAGVIATNTKQLVEKLRMVDYKKLDEAANHVLIANFLNMYNELPFCPSIEPQHNGAILSKGSYATLISNEYHKVPYITGFNSLEAAGFLDNNLAVRALLLETSPSTILHDDMHVENFAVKIKVALAIKSFYFGNSLLVATAPTDRLINFLSEDLFVRPIHETAKLHSRSAPVYFYKFSYKGTQRVLGEYKPLNGVPHADELQYIFRFRWRNNSTISRDVAMTSKMIKLWTNFAKTGNPTPVPDELLDNVSWPVASIAGRPNSLHFLNIDHPLTVDVNPHEKAMQFWEDMYQTYGHPLVLVQMESIISGHKINKVRERLGDKLELTHFDPFIQKESVYKEKKKVKSIK